MISVLDLISSAACSRALMLFRTQLLVLTAHWCHLFLLTFWPGYCTALTFSFSFFNHAEVQPLPHSTDPSNTNHFSFNPRILEVVSNQQIVWMNQQHLWLKVLYSYRNCNHLRNRWSCFSSRQVKDQFHYFYILVQSVSV